MGYCEEEDAICQTQQQLAKISKNPFFVLVLSNILIFWDTEFGVFISCQL